MRGVLVFLSLGVVSCPAPCYEVSPFSLEFDPQLVPAVGFSATGLYSGLQIVVGEGGVILSREREEDVWQHRVSGTVANLRDVAIYSVVIAVGDGGTVLRSEDQGEQWALVDVGLSAPLYGVTQDYMAAYVVGDGVILQSVDGGRTWSPKQVSAVLRAVLTSGEGQVLAVGDAGSAYLSNNWGETWRRLDLKTDANLVSIGLGPYTGGFTGSFLVTGEGGVIRQMEDELGEEWSTHDVDLDGVVVVSGGGHWGVGPGVLYELGVDEEPHVITTELQWVDIVGTTSAGWALAMSGEILYFKSDVRACGVRW